MVAERKLKVGDPAAWGREIVQVTEVDPEPGRVGIGRDGVTFAYTETLDALIWDRKHKAWTLVPLEGLTP